MTHMSGSKPLSWTRPDFIGQDVSQESWFTDERSAGSILQCNEFGGMSEYLTRPKREQEGESECHYGNEIMPNNSSREP
jgi:hypothetical protein